MSAKDSILRWITRPSQEQLDQATQVGMQIEQTPDLEAGPGHYRTQTPYEVQGGAAALPERVLRSAGTTMIDMLQGLEGVANPASLGHGSNPLFEMGREAIESEPAVGMGAAGADIGGMLLPDLLAAGMAPKRLPMSSSGKVKPFTRWTSAEDALVREHGAGKGVAELLQRSTGAVEARAKYLRRGDVGKSVERMVTRGGADEAPVAAADSPPPRVTDPAAEAQQRLMREQLHEAEPTPIGSEWHQGKTKFMSREAQEAQAKEAARAAWYAGDLDTALSIEARMGSRKATREALQNSRLGIVTFGDPKAPGTKVIEELIFESPSAVRTSHTTRPIEGGAVSHPQSITESGMHEINFQPEFRPTPESRHATLAHEQGHELINRLRRRIQTLYEDFQAGRAGQERLGEYQQLNDTYRALSQAADTLPFRKRGTKLATAKGVTEQEYAWHAARGAPPDELSPHGDLPADERMSDLFSLMSNKSWWDDITPEARRVLEPVFGKFWEF